MASFKLLLKQKNKNYEKEKRTLLNNCVEPELGKHILDSSNE